MNHCGRPECECYRKCCKLCRYDYDPTGCIDADCSCHDKPAQVKLEHFVGSLANRPWANFEKPAQEKPQIGTTGNDMGYPTAVFSGTPEQSDKPERGKAFMEEWNHEAPEQSQEKKCICGENSPDSIVVHRTDGPCYLRPRPEQSLAGQAMEERFDKKFKVGYQWRDDDFVDIAKWADIKDFITAEVQKAEERGQEAALKFYLDQRDIWIAKERQRIVAILERIFKDPSCDTCVKTKDIILRSIQEPTDV